MVFGNVAPACGARSSNQREQRILSELAPTKQELYRLPDQLGPTQPSGAPERTELPILLFGQVELDAYHSVCMIPIDVSVKRAGRGRHGGARFQCCAPSNPDSLSARAFRTSDASATDTP